MNRSNTNPMLGQGINANRERNNAFRVVYHNISCLLVSLLIELVFPNYCFQGFSINTWLQHAAAPALLSPPPEHQNAGFVEMPIGG